MNYKELRRYLSKVPNAADRIKNHFKNVPGKERGLPTMQPIIS
jgi:hypothetical protein